MGKENTRVVESYSFLFRVDLSQNEILPTHLENLGDQTFKSS